MEDRLEWLLYVIFTRRGIRTSNDIRRLRSISSGWRSGLEPKATQLGRVKDTLPGRKPGDYRVV